jgi:hypothetical protein
MLPFVVRIQVNTIHFIGTRAALRNLAPDRQPFLRKIATIASIGSSTRIEGSKLTDAQIEVLLSNIDVQSFRIRHRLTYKRQ